MSTSRWFTSRWGILVVGLVGLAIASGGGVLWLRERTRRLELAEARQAFGASLFSLAHQRLARLAESRPDDGEVLLLLGECDLARGHREEAWRRGQRSPGGVPTSCARPFFWQLTWSTRGATARRRRSCSERLQPCPQEKARNSNGPSAASTVLKDVSRTSAASFADPGVAVKIRPEFFGKSGFWTTRRCPSNRGAWPSRKQTRRTIVSGWDERITRLSPAVSRNLPAG